MSYAGIGRMSLYVQMCLCVLSYLIWVVFGGCESVEVGEWVAELGRSFGCTQIDNLGHLQVLRIGSVWWSKTWLGSERIFRTIIEPPKAPIMQTQTNSLKSFLS